MSAPAPAPSLAQAAGFIHPSLALAALALAAVPLLIHLLNRRRFRRLPWAAMGFLLAAKRRSARRIRFEQLILLGLRTLAVLCVCLAVARPYATAGTHLPAGEVRTHHLLLVDNSLSMQMGDDHDTTRFDGARTAAQALLDSFPQRDPVTIVTMVAPARVLARSSYDRRHVRDSLGALSASPRGTDVVGALTAGLEILAEADVAEGNTEVFIISDMSPRAWGVADQSPGSQAITLAKRLCAQADVHVIRCASKDASNVALVGFTTSRRLVGRHQPLSLLAEVANFGPHAARDYQLHVLYGDRIVRRVDLPAIAPSTTETVTFSVGISEAGHHPLQLRLHPAAGDALSLDDQRLLALQVADAIPVLIVEGRRGKGPTRGDAGYLATAMAPRIETTEPTLLSPKRITAADLPEEALDEYQLAVLCNVDRLTPQAWSRLEHYVHRGGGLLVTAGDALDLADLASHGYRDGEGVLPAAPLAIHGATGDEDDAVHFAMPQQTNELMADFVDAAGSSLFRARVQRYLAVDPDRLTGDVLARFDDGAPAIILATIGQGRSALLTTSVDMSWNNLPAKGDFVSLIQKLAALLARSPAAASNILTGQVYRRPLSPPEAQQPLRIVGPDGHTSTADVERHDDRLLMICRDFSAPGFYRAGAVGQADLVAVNTDPAESDPRCLDEGALTDLLGGEFSYTDSADEIAKIGPGESASEMASLLAHLALLVLACETWAAMRFGANR